MSDSQELDGVVVAGAVLVFGLPLTLLVPGLSVWRLVPKVHITRCHVLTQSLSWAQLNGLMMALLILFFCLYLEIRKRKLDEMVENVLTANQATDSAFLIERQRQAGTVRVCVELLDASAEHYENLLLLRDDLRKRDALNKQFPPQIEPSTSCL